MIDEKNIIAHTSKWLKQVVIQHNFCPFAAAEVDKNAVRYCVIHQSDPKAILEALAMEWKTLDENPAIATSLLIFPQSFPDFLLYLDFLSLAESLLQDVDYDGIYQLASFHPDYRFAGSTDEDPANYTNRSPYPMIHILREDQLEQALESFPHPDRIPLRNIDLARKLGLEKMQANRKDCFK